MSYVKSFFLVVVVVAAPSVLFTALSFIRLDPGARERGAIGEGEDNNGERHALVGAVGEGDGDGDGFPDVTEGGGAGCSLAVCNQELFSWLFLADGGLASMSDPFSSLLLCFSSDGVPEKDQLCFGVELGDNGEDGVEFPLWLLETSNFAASPAPPTFLFLLFPLSLATLMVRFPLVSGASIDTLSSTVLLGGRDIVEVVFSCSSALFLSSVLLGLL
jgi:hypothetical protein